MFYYLSALDCVRLGGKAFTEQRSNGGVMYNMPRLPARGFLFLLLHRGVTDLTPNCPNELPEECSPLGA